MSVNHDITNNDPVASSDWSFNVEGMTCASCVSRVETAVQSLPEVATASVNFASGRAVVSLHQGESAYTAVIKAVEQQGYKVPRDTLRLAIEGMNCASCVASIEKRLLQLPGVLDARINLATGQAEIDASSGAVATAALRSTIEAAGYKATEIAETSIQLQRREQSHDSAQTMLRRSIILALILGLPVFILEMGAHLLPAVRTWVEQFLGLRQSWYLQFFLTSLILAGPGRVFFVKGLPNLLRGHPDMNTLVALGTGSAWSYSTLATFTPQLLPAGALNVYFEAAAVIIVLILIGRYLEASARGRTGDAIRRLMDLQVKTASVWRDGKQQHVDVDELRVHDRIDMHPGERVPVDGTIKSGQSYIDESMITGEAAAVLKLPGDEVTGGTLNKTGAFSFVATKVGADTALSRIIQMVEQAQGAKLPVQAMLDRVTGVFVPAIMVVAALTFTLWLILGPSPALSFALVNAVAVLIIACPCAMGLATPTSIMVGTGRAAEMGVLFRKGEALQGLREVKTVALDKTGTLTRGQPELTDLILADGNDETQVLTLIASIEYLSEHPVAEAIVNAARARQLDLLPVQNFQAMPGMGVSGTVDGHHVVVGADRYLKAKALDVTGFDDTIKQLARAAKTPLFAAIDGQLVAVIAVADPVKSTSKTVIDALHAKGLRVAMITGDNQQTAEAVASQLDIDEVIAEVLPEGKVEALQRLQITGEKVAFVGDGINDAPALAQADTGISLGTGTDVAIESADVVLISGDLRGVPNAMAISDATFRNIRQNLFWAFAYNAILIPVAAGLLYPFYGILLSPMAAAFAMAASSICVVVNALRLHRFRQPFQISRDNNP